MKASELRARFIAYFERQGHLHLPSSSLVPGDDPTLLFTNAGMVPFKGIFQGEADPPAARVVTAQKCLRVSGKHNDLEEVGRTARHHTFFEMLGNFSFGDYFKQDAVSFAWEFVTDDLGLDPDRLWATVHRSDDEAERLWLEIAGLPPERVLRLGDNENFWQMGETGPCGPCSEIHYDLRPPSEIGPLDEEAFIAAGEADRFMEIWNLVFMQFDRSDGGDTPLPAPSIDTGAGLERIAAILQGVGTNYHTDLFMPMIAAAEEMLGVPYSTDPDRWEEGVSFRVLADHARAVAFLLADGVFPSNEKRGYVLRRILRRAVRHAWLMGRREPTLDRLVDVVIDTMGDAYEELPARREHLLATTRAEEERFLVTIEGGMHRFDELAPMGTNGEIAGEDAFKLHDTFGFPVDLTELMASERGYTVDVAGFEAALDEQRTRSREDRVAGAGGEVAADSALFSLGADGEQEFVGGEVLAVETHALATNVEGDRAAFVLARNPFYVEAGGQVSDTGRLSDEGWSVTVDQVLRNDRGQTVVAGQIVGSLGPEEPATVHAEVDDATRRETERNHTATHLLHAALRDRLGEHVHQAGSLVAPDRLRFDFTHNGPLTEEERREIEADVNAAVLANTPVTASQRTYREAIDAGAMALFGEKYGDVVRVIEVPGVSLELCGGTHVRSTGQIGLFKLIGETGVAAGIRRIEAITGREAYRSGLHAQALLEELSERLRVPLDQLSTRLQRLLEERDRLESQAANRRGQLAEGMIEELLGSGTSLGAGGRLVSGEVELPSGADFGDFGDELRARLGSGAAILHVSVPEDGRAAFLAVVSDDLIRSGLRAGDLVRLSSQATGSGGGGRPHFAQGGVGDPGKVEAALREARQYALDRSQAADG